MGGYTAAPTPEINSLCQEAPTGLRNAGSDPGTPSHALPVRGHQLHGLCHWLPGGRGGHLIAWAGQPSSQGLAEAYPSDLYAKSPHTHARTHTHTQSCVYTHAVTHTKSVFFFFHKLVFLTSPHPLWPHCASTGAWCLCLSLGLPQKVAQGSCESLRGLLGSWSVLTRCASLRPGLGGPEHRTPAALPAGRTRTARSLVCRAKWDRAPQPGARGASRSPSQQPSAGWHGCPGFGPELGASR